VCVVAHACGGLWVDDGTAGPTVQVVRWTNIFSRIEKPTLSVNVTAALVMRAAPSRRVKNTAAASLWTTAALLVTPGVTPGVTLAALTNSHPESTRGAARAAAAVSETATARVL